MSNEAWIAILSAAGAVNVGFFFFNRYYSHAPIWLQSLNLFAAALCAIAVILRALKT